MVFKSLVFFLLLVECQSWNGQPVDLQTKCIEVNATNNYFCECEGLRIIDHLSLEDLYYYKIKRKCQSIQPFRELLSYYKIKTLYEYNRLESYLETFCSNQINQTGYITKPQMFCELYYYYDYKKRQIFTVNYSIFFFFSSTNLSIQASNSLGQNVWNSVLNTR